MKKELDNVRKELESAVTQLQSVQAKRMKAEGQYETAMENLNKLGYSSIPEAVKAYKQKSSDLELSVDMLLGEVDTFLAEFNSIFSGALNGK